MADAPQSSGNFGDYRILRRIARGGMAEVLLALQRGERGFEQVVVLKRVLPELSGADDFVKMFLDEARLAASLNHPNVARIYDVGKAAGQYYIAMEYLPGEDLASLIQQCKRSAKQASPEIAAEIGVGVLRGLHHAHTCVDPSGRPLRIVHRDVSPANIVVTYKGDVKVIDFGIARAEFNRPRAGNERPRGKVQYLSPEQARRETVDARSDVFSAGVSLHELLTGERLFKRETDEATLAALLSGEIPPPSRKRPGLPPELDRICLRALERNREARYPSAASMASDLEAFLFDREGPKTATAVAAFMTQLFPPDRRVKKMRLLDGSLGDGIADKTPSWGFNAFGGFTPIRTVPLPALLQAAASATDSSAAPTQMISAPPLRRPRNPAWLGVALLVTFAGGLGLGVGLRTSTRTIAVQPSPAEDAPPSAAVGAAPAAPPSASLEEKPAAEDSPKSDPKPHALPVGALRLSALPAGARVAVDGVTIGNPETDIYLAAGRHTVSATAPGWSSWIAPFDLSVGDTVALSMKSERLKGVLEVACDPWCEVEVDGHKTGRTSPVRLTLPVGTHHLKVVNPALDASRDLDVNVRSEEPHREVVHLKN